MSKKRRSSAPLVHLLDAMPRPVYLLDGQGKIVFANQACGEWLGVETQSLSGQVCHYAPPSGEQATSSLADGLCPPPEVFTGTPCEEFVYAPAGCEPARQPARFLPLPGEAGEPCSVLVLVGEQGGVESTAGEDPTARAENFQLHEEVREFLTRFRGWYSLDHLAGASAAARRIREQVRLAGTGAAQVLLVGPPGSGREHVARAIHYLGAASETLTPLNCPLVDAELLESMVGAFIARCAELETEYPAALLLLDVDQLASDAQSQLAAILRVEEFEFRCLATARQPLVELAAQGAFDAELAHQLSTVVIELVPLAQRPEDIPVLAQMCLEETNRHAGRQVGGFTPEALDRLVAYGWPENIDELMNVVRQSHEAAKGPLVTPADLPKVLTYAAQAEALPPRKVEGPIELDALLAQAEAELIRRALARAKGNRAEAARMLSISRPRLLRRIEQLDLDS